MRRRAVVVLIGALSLGSALLGGCGDDGGSGGPAADTSATTLRDQDRDRDQIQDAVTDIVAACQDQDQDRLRDHTGDQDRLRDGTCDAIPDGAEVTVMSTDLTIDGDQATVEVRLQVRTTDGNTYELGDTWRFQWTDRDGWVLSEVPAVIDSSQTSPTTLQEQDRDQERDEDCDTPSTLQDQDQDRDQDCDQPS